MLIFDIDVCSMLYTINHVLYGRMMGTVRILLLSFSSFSCCWLLYMSVLINDSSSLFISFCVDCWLLYVYVSIYLNRSIDTIRWYYTCCLFVEYMVLYIVRCIVTQLILYCMINQWDCYNNYLFPPPTIVDCYIWWCWYEYCHVRVHPFRQGKSLN